MNPTVKQLLDQARAQLAGEAARLEAEVLIAHALQKTRSWLYAHADDPLDTGQSLRAQSNLQRRAAGEPVAYITGRREFWSLSLEVSPGTLIPRPETELLVEKALELTPADGKLQVVDLGTGSGAVALALASERPGWDVIAADLSPAALRVARNNGARLGLDNVEYCLSDWLAELHDRQFNLVVSNPPYVESNDACLRSGDLRFEPRQALASGVDGLRDLRRIISAAPDRLRSGGQLLLEHGPQQAAAVRSALCAAGFADVASYRDLGGSERVTLGRQWSPARC